MAPAEWPLLNGKARLHAEYPEAFRWGSQSESHSGWASPANSVVSEQSLASLKAMRANGSSPTPPSPLPRGISPKAASDAAEVMLQSTLIHVSLSELLCLMLLLLVAKQPPQKFCIQYCLGLLCVC